MVLHRTRHLCMRQQISVINAIRAHLAEFGIVAAVGRNGVEELLSIVADPSDKRVPDIARSCLAILGAQLHSLKVQILELDRMIRAWQRSNEMSMRLDECPGVGHHAAPTEQHRNATRASGVLGIYSAVLNHLASRDAAQSDARDVLGRTFEMTWPIGAIFCRGDLIGLGCGRPDGIQVAQSLNRGEIVAFRPPSSELFRSSFHS